MTVYVSLLLESPVLPSSSSLASYTIQNISDNTSISVKIAPNVLKSRELVAKSIYNTLLKSTIPYIRASIQYIHDLAVNNTSIQQELYKLSQATNPTTSTKDDFVDKLKKTLSLDDSSLASAVLLDVGGLWWLPERWRRAPAGAQEEGGDTRVGAGAGAGSTGKRSKKGSETTSTSTFTLHHQRQRHQPPLPVAALLLRLAAAAEAALLMRAARVLAEQQPRGNRHSSIGADGVDSVSVSSSSSSSASSASSSASASVSLGLPHTALARAVVAHLRETTPAPTPAPAPAGAGEAGADGDSTDDTAIPAPSPNTYTPIALSPLRIPSLPPPPSLPRPPHLLSLLLASPCPLLPCLAPQQAWESATAQRTRTLAAREAALAAMVPQDDGLHEPGVACRRCGAHEVHVLLLSTRRGIPKADTWGSKGSEGQSDRYTCRACRYTWTVKEE
jgi:DNA-directed RNA polymerase subunit M/transcription elongation factor TFIIS